MKQLPEKLFRASYDKGCVTSISETPYRNPRRKTSRTKRSSRSGYCQSSDRAKPSDSFNEQALELLRKEAFIELQRQIQRYNDQMVTRMRFIESLPCEEQQSWIEAFVQHDQHQDQDEDMEFLIDAMNDSATIKDYSLITDWQQNKLSDVTSDCTYSYTVGDMW